ncbi:MAG: PUR family DNA/RNA-binding protein [Bacteroidales bacterium]|nr:PUR family DNA/RNA-binding protein [Bacteroidales bacterium]
MYREDRDQFGYQERGAEDVFSKPVRAGKRTYFFDVKSTRGQNDYYLTITESKRRNNPDGSFTYDKHKIFLYKEDFEKFREGLDEVIRYITDNCFGGEIPQRPETESEDAF